MGVLDNQDSDARIQIYDFSIENSSSRRGLSIEPLLEEFMLVVSENYVFQNRCFH